MNELAEKLFSLRDENYKEFHSKLVPTVNPDTIIGIRTPVLRKFAARFAKSPESAVFMASLPHAYYEENNLHAVLLEKIGAYEDALRETERFLPYVDNWATCDMFLPGAFKGHTEELLGSIRAWLKSEKPYTVRFAVGMLMRLYLGENFKAEYARLVCDIRSDNYYVNMMCAWYFATALAKQYDAVLPFFAEHRLCDFVHRKAIQKAAESRRISSETKAYLKTLRRARGKGDN